MASTQAEEYKNRGNECIKNKDFTKAIEYYTQAIDACPTNYMYYSNRAAAYASLGKYQESLEDSKKTIELNGTWAKGYSRMGAALEYLGRPEEAIEAYRNGLTHDPENSQLSAALSNLTPSEGKNDFMKNIMQDKGLQDLMSNPEFMRKMASFKNDPSSALKDPELMKMFTQNFGKSEKTPYEEGPSEQTKPESKQDFTKSEMDPTPQQLAQKEKAKGNELYKKRDFEQALIYYNKAKELDPNTIIYDLNISAVLFEQKRFDECIKVCEEAVERGRSINESYKNIAKALARIGSSYFKKQQYDLAVKFYNKSLSETRDLDVVKKLKEVEKIMKEAEERSYINPELAEQERQAGNKCFSNGDFPQAIKHYTESIKRNPEDAKIYSNRAAAYTKLMEYHLCIQDCNKSLSIDPKFIKSYIRKGNALLMLKDAQQAKTVYEKAIAIEPSNQEALEGVRRCYEALNNLKPEEAAESALRDPEVQDILSDPSMRLVLETMKNDPQACSKYMMDPLISRKIEKLIDAGIIKVGHQ